MHGDISEILWFTFKAGALVGIFVLIIMSDAVLADPLEWKMWACNVRMHTDEVGWWMLDNQEILFSNENN